jgi:5-methylcytosine-specific restriction enzyme subunit McrC
VTTVSVREFKALRVGERIDREAVTVTRAQRDHLERFNERHQQRFKARPFGYGSRGSLVAQNHVGVIHLGKHQVEILPKIDAGDEEVRRNLARMLCVALDVRLHGRDGSAMHRTDSILDVLVRLFCGSLWKALHQGPARRYEIRQETLAVVRGRIDIAQQVRRNLGRPDRIACAFEEFTEDTPVNQILKAALRLLIRVVRSADNQRNLNELLFCLADVSDVPRQSLDWHRASTNRLTSRFAPLLRMAKTFLDGASSDVLSGSDQGFALLFDMNMLFEEYIGRVLQRAFAPADLDVRRQGPVRHLALSLSGAPAFKLKPDAVAMRGSVVNWIVDTKWKRLAQQATREGVAAGDMYQMSIYARQYQAAHVMLLYPHHAELDGHAGLRAGYSLQGDLLPEGSSARISVATVDLRDLASVPQCLQALLGEQTHG